MARRSTTTTTTVLNPSAPVLNAITRLGRSRGRDADTAQRGRSRPAGAAVTSYSIEYSTSSTFPAGQLLGDHRARAVDHELHGHEPDARTRPTTSRSSRTPDANSAVSNVQSFADARRRPVATCKLGQLNVTGATIAEHDRNDPPEQRQDVGEPDAGVDDHRARARTPTRSRPSTRATRPIRARRTR